jgi:hypothetical protein
VALGSTSIIRFPPLGFDSESELTSESYAFSFDHEGLLGVTFIGVVPSTFMVLTPFSHVLLRPLISLLVLHLGWIILRETISTWSPAVWVGVSFSLLQMQGVFRSKLSSFLLKFMLDLDIVSINFSQ